MRKFGTIDCETDPFKFERVPKPFIWGLYDDDGFRYFYDTDDFIDYISNYEGILYAHNGGKFDFHFLFSGIVPQEKIMVINGRIAKIKIGKCELRDSFLLLPVPLSAYKKDEVNYDNFEYPIRIQHMHEIVEYLKGDCVYLYEILQAQFEEFGQKLTLATSAFDFWHKKFNPDEYKPRSGQGYFEHFKPYYYGGRVQCFQKGLITKEFKVNDINSAYPYAMTFGHPYGQEYSVLKKLPENIEQCFIHFWGKSQGVLPYREKGKLYFPDDDLIREYKATGWEMKLGLEKGLIKIHKIERVTKFSRSINFQDYVSYFFKLKAEYKDKNPAKYLLTKLYLNSLYGKFGQSSLDHRDYDLIEPKYIQDYIVNDNYEFEGEIGDYALMSAPIAENHMKFFNVCTAASITGFVRAYLYKHILECETPLYCDTDSIAYSGSGNFEIGKELGQWENEGEFKSGAIGGKKLYAFEYKNPKVKDNIPINYKISSKGVKLNEKEIYAIAKGGEIEYKNIAPTFSINKQPTFLTRKVKMT